MLMLLNNNPLPPFLKILSFTSQTFSRANFPPVHLSLKHTLRFARGGYNGRVGQVNAAPGRMKLTPGPR